MPCDSLAGAVEQFAAVLQDLPDSDLDQAWAWGAYDSEGVRFALFRTYEELRQLAVQTASQRLAQGSVTSPSQRILAQIHAAYRDLQAVLLALPEGVEDQVPAEGEWSLRRVLAHIVGADVGFYVAVRYALDRHRSGDGRPAAIPDEAWDSILQDNIASVESILDGPLAGVRAYHATLHERVLREFADITEEELSISSLYWEGYPLSLRFRLHRFDSHLRQHTIQVGKALHTLGRPPSEARRILRLVYAALAETEGVTIGAWDVGIDLRNEAAQTIAARAGEIAGILA
jgi:uncharacterized damage-inducible protein DinB